MSELEQKFHNAMIQVYKDAKEHCQYHATYFIQMVSDKGGLKTAKQLIATDKPSDGFTTLYLCGRLDLCVEAVALKPIYAELFTERELEKARERLLEYNYEPPTE